MLNQVQLIGRLGRDPEVRYTQEGKCIAHLALATSESHKDKETGEIKQWTEWHRVVLFGRPGEVAGEFLKKGALVYIQGKIRTRKWKNQEGQEQSTTEIQGVEMKMLEGRSDRKAAGPASEPGPTGGGGSTPLPSEAGFDPEEDDLPEFTARVQNHDPKGRARPRM